MITSLASLLTVLNALLSWFEFTSGAWQQPMREGNPQFGRTLKLISDTGCYLAILPNRHVKGVNDSSSKYTLLKMEAAGAGEVRLQGVETGLYLAMDDRGYLYGSSSPEDSATVFRERVIGGYNAYESRDHEEWFVAIRKNGTIKPGPLTQGGKRSSKFLPKRSN